MISIKTDADDTSRKLKKLADKLDDKVAYAVELAAVDLEGKIAEKVSSNVSPQLHPATIAHKGSSETLIDIGTMLDQVDHKMHGNEAEVGVFGSRAPIALVHEFGKDIAVTPRMRAYLHHIGIHLKASTTHIHIPERSFMRSTFEENKRRLKEIIKEETRQS